MPFIYLFTYLFVAHRYFFSENSRLWILASVRADERAWRMKHFNEVRLRCSLLADFYFMLSPII